MNAPAADLPAARRPRNARNRPAGFAGWLALGGFALLLLLAVLLIHSEGVRMRIELDAAAQETVELRVRQEVLRAQFFELSAHLDDSRGRSRSLPTAIAGGRDSVPKTAPP